MKTAFAVLVASLFLFGCVATERPSSTSTPTALVTSSPTPESPTLRPSPSFSCPQYMPPSPDYCKDGFIVSGGKNEKGCDLPPKCVRLECLEKGYECHNVQCPEGYVQLPYDCYGGRRTVAPIFCCGKATDEKN